jgi:hypothetical protein
LALVGIVAASPLAGIELFFPFFFGVDDCETLANAGSLFSFVQS